MTWLDWLTLTGNKLAETMASLGPPLAALLPFVAWCAWWLAGANWRKVWPVLARGGWVPAVLLAVIATFVWIKLQPGECNALGLVTIPHRWWQAGSVAALVAVALLCGWLQGYFGWTPREVPVEPAPHGHGHHHGHAAAHH